jgi:hypothetical protein
MNEEEIKWGSLTVCLYIVSFGWFALATSPHHYISTSVAQVYIAAALGNLFVTGTVALFYEATVEITFPVGKQLYSDPYKCYASLIMCCNNIYR